MRSKKIAGVCAGFARHLGADVVLVRIVWVTTVFFTGLGLLAYIVAWIAMPQDPAGEPIGAGRAA